MPFAIQLPTPDTHDGCLHQRGTLQNYIESHGSATEELALQLVIDICSGLQQLLSLDPPMAHRYNNNNNNNNNNSIQRLECCKSSDARLP
jgi:hypothetical protein